MKTDYEEHAAKEHPEDLPEDLTPEPVAKTGADLNSMQVFIGILVLPLFYLIFEHLIFQDIRMIEILPLEDSWGMPLQVENQTSAGPTQYFGPNKHFTV